MKFRVERICRSDSMSAIPLETVEVRPGPFVRSP